ncbi:hypothetical protein [Streptomyces coelicoflavus]|uniref:hypothetical protein n=1 Tax=Streptomyces coelicoflavus TaxID=285562 RepID=UPI003691AE66
MIRSAVLPGAALRVLRTAAGRRALHVALLVGGLFLLGLLCGGRAQAADGAPDTLADTVGRVLDVPAQAQAQAQAQTQRQTRKQGAEAVPGPRSDAVSPGLRPLAEKVGHVVEDRLVRPVGDGVETVTEGVEGLGAVVTAEVPPVQMLPDPSGPTDPAGRTDRTDPSGRSGSADPGPRPEPAPEATEADDAGAGDDSGAADTRVADGAGNPARVVGYGPEPGLRTVPAAHASPHPAGVAHTEDAPGHPSPTGDPDGSLGTVSGADQGTSRHGDVRAVTPLHRITFRIVPGAPERADAAGVREPYRDIPVSPA